MGETLLFRFFVWLTIMTFYNFSILDKAFARCEVDQFSTNLERIILNESHPTCKSLKVRDCIAEYLGFGAVYFVLLI